LAADRRPWLFLVVDIGERLPIVVADDVAGVEFFNCAW
jgi:hypothetical protein